MNQDGRMEGGREGCNPKRAKRVRPSRAARLELAWRAFGVLVANAISGAELLDRCSFETLFQYVCEAMEEFNNEKPFQKSPKVAKAQHEANPSQISLEEWQAPMGLDAETVVRSPEEI